MVRISHVIGNLLLDLSNRITKVNGKMFLYEFVDRAFESTAHPSVACSNILYLI
jgi:hypothetical protein